MSIGSGNFSGLHWIQRLSNTHKNLEENMEKSLVIGGGLVGALLAAVLAKRGHAVHLVERRPDPRLQSKSAGKSINLAISDRGWRAVDIIGARKAIEDIAIPMYGRCVHDRKGNTNLQPYGKEDQAIYSVSRGGLNCILLDFAERYGAKITFGARCTDVDFENTSARYSYGVGYGISGEPEETADLIFGTDGAFSQVRTSMQKTRRFNLRQTFIPHGYRELLMPAADDGDFRMGSNALHIWPRGKYMLIALPNLDRSFTCTLFMPYEGVDSFAKLQTDDDIREFFKEEFPDFYDLMPDVAANYREHPLSDLVVIRCYPWVSNRTAILGDASHAVVPFYGQGMNAGFEDVRVLDELLTQYGTDYDKALDAFQRMRKPEADAISDLALYNYIEMRDLVGDPRFVLQKKIEAKIYARHPDKWMPLYSQVTFSHIPYSQALKTGVKQDEVMQRVMDLPDIENRWDSPEIEDMILRGIAETSDENGGNVRSISQYMRSGGI